MSLVARLEAGFWFGCLRDALTVSSTSAARARVSRPEARGEAEKEIAAGGGAVAPLEAGASHRERRPHLYYPAARSLPLAARARTPLVKWTRGAAAHAPQRARRECPPRPALPGGQRGAVLRSLRARERGGAKLEEGAESGRRAGSAGSL